MGSKYLMGTEFQLGKMKKSWRWMVVMNVNHVNIFNAIKLYTYKW